MQVFPCGYSHAVTPVRLLLCSYFPIAIFNRYIYKRQRRRLKVHHFQKILRYLFKTAVN